MFKLIFGLTVVLCLFVWRHPIAALVLGFISVITGGFGILLTLFVLGIHFVTFGEYESVGGHAD
jgi:hypothetical protein